MKQVISVVGAIAPLAFVGLAAWLHYRRHRKSAPIALVVAAAIWLMVWSMAQAHEWIPFVE